MTTPYPEELGDLQRFTLASEARKLQVANEVCQSLGTQWSPLALAGAQRLCRLLYTPAKIEFILVPGGKFTMGFRPDDLSSLERYVDISAQEVSDFVKQCEATARPLREVLVRPHLLSRHLLTGEQVHYFDSACRSDEVTLESATRLATSGGFRLPSEAEYEWAAREGGQLTFTCDVAKGFDGTYQTGLNLENGFGVIDLLCSQWLSDDPHANYCGAPETSEPWWDTSSVRSDRIGEGSRRGALETGIEDAFSLLYCLASLRWGGDLVRLRLARSL